MLNFADHKSAPSAEGLKNSHFVLRSALSHDAASTTNKQWGPIMRAKLVCVCSLAAVLLFAVTLPAQTGDFTIIALPDTQNESQFFPAALSSQTKWIAANRRELNIQMVLGEG